MFGFKALSILLAVAAVTATPLTEQRVPVFKQRYGSGDVSKIINGKEATKGQFPFQAAVYMDGQAFCGGSLISPKWIMTAAHCVDGFNSFRVMLGAHNVRDTNEEGRVVVESNNGFPHEDYDDYELINDIGLIGLTKDVPLADRIKVSALPPLSFIDKVFDGTPVVVSGWGKTSDQSNSISPTLQFVDLTIVNNDVCRRVYGDGIVKTMFCVTGENMKSTCNGDSGGPLTIGAESNRTQVGIVSFGAAAGCAKGYPNGFTAVAHYLKWISGKTGIAIQN